MPKYFIIQFFRLASAGCFFAPFNACRGMARNSEAVSWDSRSARSKFILDFVLLD
jgi:hypothetical protein